VFRPICQYRPTVNYNERRKKTAQKNAHSSALLKQLVTK